jgi:hypothetical protein
MVIGPVGAMEKGGDLIALRFVLDKVRELVLVRLAYSMPATDMPGN